MSARIFLTPRDISILIVLGEYGLLTSDVLHERFWAKSGPRACQQRLRLLTDQKLIRPMRAPIVTRPDRGGTAPLAYALAPIGADVCEEYTGIRPRRVVHDSLSPFTLRHRIDLVRVRLAWDLACGKAGLATTKWLLDSDPDPHASNAPAPAHRRLLSYNFLVNRQQISYRPDAVSLTFVPTEQGETPLVIAWELDRSTEGHKQVRAKLPGLTQFIDQRPYLRHFEDLPNVPARSIWVVQSRRRLAELQTVFAASPIAAAIRLAFLPTLCSGFSLRDKIWTDTSGQPRAILPSSASTG